MPDALPAPEGFTDLTPLAEGPLADVHRATEDESGTVVALKVFRDPLEEDAALRFEDACELLTAASRHPGICTLRWFGATEDDRPYLASDLCVESLAGRVRERGVIEANDVAAVLRRAAGALAHAHALGLLHDDIQPGNLLLDPTGEPVLTDFALDGLPRLPGLERGSVQARAAHVAPEVLQGGPASVASDVWSLASTGFHLLSGTAPFRRAMDDSSATMLARIVLDPLPDLRPQGIPPWLCDVLEAAMAKAPEDRLPSMEALFEAIESKGASITS